MTDNPEHQRERFRAYLANVEAAQKVLCEVELPEFWAHPCPCMVPDSEGVLDHNPGTLQVVEPGYWRWESIDEVVALGDVEGNSVGPYVHASTDGWDSMSENGSVEYIECAPELGGCGALWAVPEELEWD